MVMRNLYAVSSSSSSGWRTVYWVLQGRAGGGSRIPWMVAMATDPRARSPPFLGPIIYLFFRPPEYL
jgi:hypothetical protein